MTVAVFFKRRSDLVSLGDALALVARGVALVVDCRPGLWWLTAVLGSGG